MEEKEVNTDVVSATGKANLDSHSGSVILLIILLIATGSFSVYTIFNSEPSQDYSSETERLEMQLYEAEKEKLRLKAEIGGLQSENELILKERKSLADDLDKQEKQPTQIFQTEKDSPFDHVKQNQLRVLKNKVELNVKDVFWWNIADTNSMDPVLDIGANALSVPLKSEGQLHEGDVAFYHSEIAKQTIVHRVVEINSDDQGWYSKFKGDNLEHIDPENVRFKQIEGVLIGIIY